ncbi:MAG TPA: TIGR03087 family PEP-CTERM/XrtA system glycosyltransferase [Phycisphaerae bacterium]|nr:TIGR03087 family PEP-CTERM/XrtA system glycosyltransferase [Phycisphaerae bacterium]
MNILYLAHRIPYPPNKGDKIRSYHMLRYLAERHDVWCACFVDDPADFEHVAALRRICRDVIALPLKRGWATVRGLCHLAIDEPASEGFYRDHGMARRLRALSARVDFDAALFYSSSMGQYADAVRARRKVIDFCDLDSRKWAELAGRARWPRSALLAAEARLLAEREHELYAQFDATLLISAAEAAGWRAYDRERLHIVGNGVELPALPADLRYDSGVVGFVGDMRYAPNVDGVCWFAQEVWPRVYVACPRAEFHIVGRGAPKRVNELGAIPGIRVIGEVAQVLPHLLNFQLVVAPLRIARGVQNKVLEAMAAARPVVATPQAATGIESGAHLLIAADAAAMVESVQSLLDVPDECRRLGQCAIRQTSEIHDWGQRLSGLDAVLFKHDCPPIPQAVDPRLVLVAR